MPDIYLTKGRRVTARWFDSKLVALAGNQLKVGATPREVTGIVTHIRGDHPSAPTQVDVHIQPDDGGDEVVVKHEWITDVWEEEE